MSDFWLYIDCNFDMIFPIEVVKIKTPSNLIHFFNEKLN